MWAGGEKRASEPYASAIKYCYDLVRAGRRKKSQRENESNRILTGGEDHEYKQKKGKGRSNVDSIKSWSYSGGGKGKPEIPRAEERN